MSLVGFPIDVYVNIMSLSRLIAQCLRRQLRHRMTPTALLRCKAREAPQHPREVHMSKDSTQTALLWIVAAGFFMQSLDTTIVNTALPSIAHSLHVAPLAMQPIVVAYTLTMAMLTPASGWLGSPLGPRPVEFAAILPFVLGSLCCASAQSLDQLVVARVIQGIGGSMLLPIGRLAVLRSVTGGAYGSAVRGILISGP